jgi:ABC-2 type transport system permease protein
MTEIQKCIKLKKALFGPKHAYEILKATAFATYKEWAAYRSHMAVSIFVGPMYFLVQVYIWKAVFSSRGTINGLTLKQMLSYYGIAAVINYIVFDFADWNLQMHIRTGSFITFMLRPMSHRFYALSQKVGHRMLGFWVEFLPIYLLFLFVFKIPLIPAHPIWAVLSLILSFLMSFLVNYCVGMTAFWLTKADGVRRMFSIMNSILAGSFIPLTFFPAILQKVFFFLPFQFITYVPISVMIGSYKLGGIEATIPQIVFIQALAVLLMFFISEIMWRLGVRKFTGVGA